jgi:hypothetical protein
MPVSRQGFKLNLWQAAQKFEVYRRAPLAAVLQAPPRLIPASQFAEKLQVRIRFVSGCRFSGTVSPAKSIPPSGAVGPQVTEFLSKRPLVLRNRKAANMEIP